MAAELQQRVIKIVSNIMTVPLASVTLESSADSVESWDSLRHMNLILALEQEFSVRFADDQVVKMLSVEQIATESAGMVQRGGAATQETPSRAPQPGYFDVCSPALSYQHSAISSTQSQSQTKARGSAVGLSWPVAASRRNFLA